MGYPRHLDEYTDTELKSELDRRDRARTKGVCDYCGRDPETEPCKFRLRHYQQVDVAGLLDPRLKKSRPSARKRNLKVYATLNKP